MIENFKSKKINKKRISAITIIYILFVIWLFTPPGNKFAQACLYGNYTKHAIAVITNKNTTNEYIYHRNNAAYFARMNNYDKALNEMDIAITKFPEYEKTEILNSMYAEKAYIELKLKKYDNALNNLLKSSVNGIKDYFVIGILLEKKGLHEQAMSYCNSIVNASPNAIAGYACLANIYEAKKEHDAAIKLWDYVAEKKPNNAYIYVERAKCKMANMDLKGYNEDIAKAKKLNSNINIEDSIITKTIDPTKIVMPIIKDNK